MNNRSVDIGVDVSAIPYENMKLMDIQQAKLSSKKPKNSSIYKRRKSLSRSTLKTSAKADVDTNLTLPDLK